MRTPVHDRIEHMAKRMAAEWGFPIWLVVFDYETFNKERKIKTEPTEDFGIEICIQDKTYRSQQFTPHESVTDAALRSMIIDHFGALLASIDQDFEMGVYNGVTRYTKKRP